MDTTSNLGLPFIMAAQAQKHVTHNEALRALDAIVHLMVLDKDLSAPPGSPADGARHIVASSPTGAWSGQTGKIAAYQDAAWAFYTPREGWLAWVADEDKLYVWTGSAWAEFAGGGSLANIVEDTTPQLGGDLDANGHNVGFDNGTGITDDAGNEQVVFRKTASAVNQVGLTNAATGSAPQIAAEGGDTNIDLTLAGKGTGHPKAALFGINATADTTTRFAVAAAASLFNHAGNGHQHKINKNAAGDTASFLFQTAFSGRAEMGTAGDDNFHFKVSPDGSSWKEAILIDRSTGAASFPFTPKREVLVANRTYFVRTDGSDSNNGLANTSGGAFLTVQKAINVAYGDIDLGGFDVTIDVGNGTYTGAIAQNYPQVGAGRITISGDTTTPSNVVISATSPPRGAIVVSSNAILYIEGLRITTTTAGHGLFAYAGGMIIASGAMNFHTMAAGYSHMVVTGGGAIHMPVNYSITGNAENHLNAEELGVINLDYAPGISPSPLPTVTLTGTPALAVFARAIRGGLIIAYGITFSGSATGQRYNASVNGMVRTDGGGANYFPGNAAGATATGGQYV